MYPIPNLEGIVAIRALYGQLFSDFDGFYDIRIRVI